MNVIVVGGGIIGLATAYFLSQRGVDVVVLEKSSLGSGSTGRANGGIREQFSTEVSIRLSQESVKVWEKFEELFGTDISYRRPGYLFLARKESTADLFRQNVTLQREMGVESRFITPREASRYCPGLLTDQFVGATYNSNDGFADPHLGLQGFSRGATQLGATISTGVEVVDILTEGESTPRVTGVKTREEKLPSDYVVNAAGPWARAVAEMAGIHLEITPKRRQLMIVNPENPLPDTVPLTADLDAGVHFRPERDGAAVVGGHFSSNDPPMDPDNYDEKITLDWSVKALEQAGNCATYFGPETRIKRGWAGLYSVTPDHHPIIEETIPGFVNAVGFAGHGFMQSPATGKLVSEIVVDGESSLLDISALASDRFQTGEELHEGTVID